MQQKGTHAKTRKQSLAELRLAKTFLERRFRQESRLPIETTVAVVAGINLALWVLLALALDRLLF